MFGASSNIWGSKNNSTINIMGLKKNVYVLLKRDHEGKSFNYFPAICLKTTLRLNVKIPLDCINVSLLVYINWSQISAAETLLHLH